MGESLGLHMGPSQLLLGSVSLPPPLPPSGTVLHTFPPHKSPHGCLVERPAVAKSLRFPCTPRTTSHSCFQSPAMPAPPPPPPPHSSCLLFTTPNTPSPQGWLSSLPQSTGSATSSKRLQHYFQWFPNYSMGLRLIFAARPKLPEQESVCHTGHTRRSLNAVHNCPSISKLSKGPLALRPKEALRKVTQYSWVN